MESETKKLKFPGGVFFIVGNEFCERFSYYGMKAVLSLYLHQQLGLSEDLSTTAYHVFLFGCYFTPLLGAILSDNYIGKFKTIFYLSVVYAIGNVLLAVSASPIKGYPQLPFSLLALAIIAVGTGGIKPCVAAFGGDQFQMPEQEASLKRYFSMFYFAINAGSLVSTVITPIFRKDLSCFGDETCYPMAFGLPAVLFFIALVLFLCGKRVYKVEPPSGNVFFRVLGCFFHGIGRAVKSKEKKDHWLDHAADKYNDQVINETKCFVSVTILFLPIPIFWALFDQQGSRWTFQATRMDGETYGYVLKPDQIQVANPAMILLLIPIFETVIYPCLGKLKLLRKPLQRITVGGILAALSFIISAILEMKLEATHPTLPDAGNYRLNAMNLVNCPVLLNGTTSYNITAMNSSILNELSVKDFQTFDITVPDRDQCEKEYGNSLGTLFLANVTLNAKEKSTKAVTLILDHGGHLQIHEWNDDDIMKTSEGDPKVRFLYEATEPQSSTNFMLKNKDEVHKIQAKSLGNTSSQLSSDFSIIEVNKYDILVKLNGSDTTIGSIYAESGGVYNVLVTRNNDSFRVNIFTVTPKNSIHMAWLLPQYLVITVAEIMLSITGLEFCFTQAPPSLKSMMQSLWLMNVATGNVIVAVIAEAKIFESQVYEFLLFASLMLIVMFIFAIIAHFYKSKEWNLDGSLVNQDAGKDNAAFEESKL